MSNVLEKVIERISAYEFLTSIIPGAVYSVLVERLTPFRILSSQIFANLVIFYFIGTIINRIGSFVVGFAFRHWAKDKIAPYDEYVAAEAKQGRVRGLMTIRNMYRSFTALSLTLLLTIILGWVWPSINSAWIKTGVIITGCIGLFILFGASYVRQTKFVTNRVKAVTKNLKDKKIILSEDE